MVVFENFCMFNGYVDHSLLFNGLIISKCFNGGWITPVYLQLD
jgi:hypothetical protein